MSLPCPEEAANFPRKTIDLRFTIGQDKAGHWVVLEAHGRRGGIFVDKQAAIRYADSETPHRPNAIHFSEKPLNFWGSRAPAPDEQASPPASERLPAILLHQSSPLQTPNRRRRRRSLMASWPRLRRRIRRTAMPLGARYLASRRGFR